jgi:hypothetical protein
MRATSQKESAADSRRLKRGFDFFLSAIRDNTRKSAADSFSSNHYLQF